MKLFLITTLCDFNKVSLRCKVYEILTKYFSKKISDSIKVFTNCYKLTLQNILYEYKSLTNLINKKVFMICVESAMNVILIPYIILPREALQYNGINHSCQIDI